MSALSFAVEVSAGELIDKITILEIKRERIADAAKRANVEAELETLARARDAAIPPTAELIRLTQRLKDINVRLWVIEDDIRDKERTRAFDAGFIELARAVYRTNDERADVKRAINNTLGSRLIEEKSYAAY
ncbi:MAG: DUF6165 family protein [Proteobacteria bacterium]|nr:DUF6165 family protein [Pseudomonadota bacterium]